jgi:hypothetical protein
MNAFDAVKHHFGMEDFLPEPVGHDSRIPYSRSAMLRDLLQSVAQSSLSPSETLRLQ